MQHGKKLIMIVKQVPVDLSQVGQTLFPVDMEMMGIVRVVG